MEHHNDAGTRRLRDAVVTLAVVVLAAAALDDITTDTARSFPLERSALAGCAVWFLVVAWRLWRYGPRGLGVVSFGLVIVAALAQPAIGPGTVPTQVAYLATVGTLAWFMVLAGVLAALAWRSARRRAASS